MSLCVSHCFFNLWLACVSCPPPVVRSDLQRVFISSPGVFTLSTAVAKKRVDQLEKYFGTLEAVSEVFRKNPSVLQVPRIEHRLEKVQEFRASFFLFHSFSVVGRPGSVCAS